MCYYQKDSCSNIGSEKCNDNWVRCKFFSLMPGSQSVFSKCNFSFLPGSSKGPWSRNSHYLAAPSLPYPAHHLSWVLGEGDLSSTLLMLGPQGSPLLTSSRRLIPAFQDCFPVGTEALGGNKRGASIISLK